jgi:hypothetical protein
MNATRAELSLHHMLALIEKIIQHEALPLDSPVYSP